MSSESCERYEKSVVKDGAIDLSFVGLSEEGIREISDITHGSLHDCIA